jgi:hypothetical protein
MVRLACTSVREGAEANVVPKSVATSVKEAEYSVREEEEVEVGVEVGVEVEVEEV